MAGARQQSRKRRNKEYFCHVSTMGALRRGGRSEMPSCVKNRQGGLTVLDGASIGRF
jgi:hypothetical protein